jgi:protein-tyrosine phosphatase/membrane-associated phospholipid phosphatase
MGDIHGVDGAPRRRLMVQAFKTATFLSVLFIVVYGGTNWFTAQRPAEQVGVWYFAWELPLVPYVPLLMIPYMSIDLFFFMAAFLCRDERELSVFAKRVTFSILVAAAFFLLLPLKLAWPERPRGAGWFGDFVEASCTAPILMEYPHNLFPTLHIALCVILADIYGRHTRGVVRALAYVWFVLIGVSTVLTWQHHLIDVAGGLLLAAFAFHFHRDASPRSPVTPNPRIAGYYGLAAALALVGVPFTAPWGVFLLWPAVGFGMIAAGYLGLGPGVFRKERGGLPLSAWIVQAPALLGQYLSLAYYRRRSRAWDELVPGVWIGRRLSNAEAAVAIDEGVTAVLDLTAEFPEASPFRASRYRNLPILDLTAPTPDQLREAVDFIAAEAARGTVYVHCKIGYSRTAAVAGAYLLASGQVETADDAIARLREVRPAIIIRPEAVEALHAYARDRMRRLSPARAAVSSRSKTAKS